MRMALGRGNANGAASEGGPYGVTIAIGQRDGFATSDCGNERTSVGPFLLRKDSFKRAISASLTKADGDVRAGETELLAHAAQEITPVGAWRRVRSAGDSESSSVDFLAQ